MTPQRRQRLLLGALAVLVAVAAWVRLVPWLTAGPGTAAVHRGGRAGAAGEVVQVTPLETGLLAAEPRVYDPGRNPFGFGQPPPPPGPTPEELAARAAAEAARQRAEAEAQAREQTAAATPPEETVPARPQPPEFGLHYLGSFGPKGKRIAVFSDGDEIYNAVVGDVLAGKFLVADIGYESVAIRYVGFPDEPPTRVGIGS